MHRAVEAQVVAEGGKGRGVGVAFHHPGGHVARHETHQGEDQDAHQEERRDRQGQPAEQISLHVARDPRLGLVAAYLSSHV